MKYEWKRQEKELYGAKTTPAVVTIPAQSYIVINGTGDPNDADFSNRVSALYSAAYAVKMAYKKAAGGEFDDFAVYPLEGVWQKIEGGRLVKKNLHYTLMIRQPDFIGQDSVNAALERTKAKSPIRFWKKSTLKPYRAELTCRFCTLARMTTNRCRLLRWMNSRVPAA